MDAPPDPPSHEELLISGAFEAFLGSAERQHFEAKRFAGYDLDSSAGRYELVKDVSAMANGGGGFLVLGLATEKDAAGPDVVRGLDLRPESGFPWQRIAPIVRNHTFPRLRSAVAWVPFKRDPTLGAVIIRVPSFRPSLGRHLIIKPFDDGSAAGGFVFGYAERAVSVTITWDAERAAQILRNGTSSVAQRLEALETQVGNVLEVTRATHQLQQQLAKRGATWTTTTADAQETESLDGRIDDILRDESE